MGSIIVRYPGRACLLGEHCDWAGGSSLTIPVPMGIEIRAEPEITGLHIHTDLEGEVLEGSWDVSGSVSPLAGPLRFVPAAAYLLNSRGIPVQPSRLWVRSDLPPGRGFSSSAAFTLGILDVLARSGGVKLSSTELADLAFEVEHGLLGIDCGRLDPTACAAGEPVFVRWGREPTPSCTPDVRPVCVEGVFHLVVGIFGRPRETAKVLSRLSAWHTQPLGDPDGDAFRGAIHTFASAAEQAARALESGDPEALGQAMNTAQDYYAQKLMGRADELNAPLLHTTCSHLRKNLGAIGAKFSGAGGDGSFIALFYNEPDARTAALNLEDRGLRTWVLSLEST
jgi:mevalonate kinase